MSKIAPCLWFAREAEEAANFYVSLFPDSRIDHVQKNIVDTPAGKPDEVLVVNFTLAGQRFMALNGGSRIEFNHAISLEIDCADQAEVDRLWDGLCNGGTRVECGGVTDRFGVSRQVVELVGGGRLEAQGRANIVPFLEAMAEGGLEAAYRG